MSLTAATSFETARELQASKSNMLQSSLAMATVESFETAPETPSEPATSRSQDQHYDQAHKRDSTQDSASDTNELGTGARNSTIAETEATYTESPTDVNREVRPNGPLQEVQPVVQQVETIDKLIDSLHSSTNSSHTRNTSAYSFEPLMPEELDSAPQVPNPRQASIRSLRSSKSRKISQSQSRDNATTSPSLVEKRKSSTGQARDSPTSSLPSAQGDRPRDEPEPKYPPPAKLALILISLYIAIFLVALDRTIIGPAIPEITNKFNSIGDIGWYGSAYMLTSCGFILLYGRIYTFYPTKHVFLSSILIFEIGSAICGAATSSNILIVGRAIAGLGSSGIYTGAILIILQIVPLHRRPLLQGLFGACFGVASVAGPLLGGAFTGSKATWRWCFYINLPLGAVTIGIVMLFVHVGTIDNQGMGLKETLWNLDPVGVVLFLPCITCLLLALEWGAAEYPWGDGHIVALLTVFAVLFISFGVWEYFTQKTTATIPGRILFQRSVAFGGLSQFCVGASMLLASLYTPLWFQAIKDLSAIQSGIRTIPLVLSVVISSIFSGAAVQKIGYYKPFMIVGSVLMSVGAALLTTWNMGSTAGQWIGYQIILGLGVGFTMQHPNMAIQIVLPKPDIPTGTALLSLCQTLGGAVFVAVGQNTFISKFYGGLHGIEGVNENKAVHSGATELKHVVPEALLARVLQVYNNSLTKGPFFAALIIACFTVPAALGMQWRSVKENMQLPETQRHLSQDEEAAKRPGSFLPRSASNEQETTEKESPPPEEPPKVHAWRKLLKGESPCVLVRKLNTDLKAELDSPPH